MNHKDELIQSLAVQWSGKDQRSLLSPELLSRMVDCWEMGLATNVAVARELNISSKNLNRWLTEYPELTELRDLCYVKTNTEARKNIHRSIKKGSVETSKWFLERTDPEFMKKENAPAVMVNVVTVAEREQALAKYMERFTDERVIESSVVEERELPGVDQGEDTVTL